MAMNARTCALRMRVWNYLVLKCLMKKIRDIPDNVGCQAILHDPLCSCLNHLFASEVGVISQDVGGVLCFHGFLKNVGPLSPWLQRAHFIITLSPWKGSSCSWWGFHIAQNLRFCLYTAPFKWICASSVELCSVSDFPSVFRGVYFCLIDCGQSEVYRVISAVPFSAFIGLLSLKSATANLLSFSISWEPV